MATIEKSGIPSVFIIYEDQNECFEQAARVNGIPHLRRVLCSRTLPGPEDVARFMHPLMDALVRPLTADEKKGGRWEVPHNRVLFEGTLEEADEFYSQQEKVPTLGNAPMCLYTDGLPVRIPTEERVAEMLKGTSHKPDEVITFQTDHRLGDRLNQMGNSGKKGDTVYFMPMRRRATVEIIATIGVMAGCKPADMPVLLAIAESGGGCGDGRGSSGFCVSGPIAKEIGMNFEVNVLGAGNQANRSLGRAADLMFRNLGGNIPSVTNCGVYGSSLANCFPENMDALPPGWKGLNEEHDYKRNESVLVPFAIPGQSAQFSPGGYRAFQKSGHGGIARRLGVKGIPGPHNFLEYIIPGLWAQGEGGITMIMLPEMARHLYDSGFKSKDDIYEWLYRKSFTTVKEYRTHSWPDMRTNGWIGIEKSSGKPWKDLPDDYMVPAMNDPYECAIIVTGAGEEMLLYGGSRFPNSEAYSIDAWR